MPGYAGAMTGAESDESAAVAAAAAAASRRADMPRKSSPSRRTRTVDADGERCFALAEAMLLALMRALCCRVWQGSL